MEIRTPQIMKERLWRIEKGGSFKTKCDVTAMDVVLYGKDWGMELIINKVDGKFIVVKK